MSFSSSFKKIFGFGTADHSEDDEQLLTDDIRETTSPHQSAATSSKSTDAGANEALVESLEVKEGAVSEIFDSVIAVFNNSLPDFLKSGVNPEAQREYLYNSLHQSMKDYLTRLKEDAKAHAEEAVARTTRETTAEVARLRQEKQTIENQRASIKEQQLSADRQRRALQNRVGDLEVQLASLEAEREQFELENKSLLNKIKLAEIQPGIIDELTAENNRLKEQLASGAPAEAPDTAEKDARIAELEDEVNLLQKRIDAYDEGNKTSTEMLNSMQHELVEERRKAADTLAETAGKLESANNTIIKLQKQIKEKDAQLREAEEVVSGMDKISAQMQQVEEAISKRDEKIKSLQTKNKELKAAVEKLEKRLSSKKGGAPELPFGTDHADDPAEKYNAEMITTEPIRPEELSDEDFHNGTWLKSTPPKGTVIRSELSDEEFGYQAPPKKPKNKDHDAQLSLF